MTILKIALLQILPGGSLEENLRTGVEACRTAKSLGADIALFPEMWSNGYRISGRPAEEWTAEAVPADGGFTGAFKSLAAGRFLMGAVHHFEESRFSFGRCSLS